MDPCLQPPGKDLEPVIDEEERCPIPGMPIDGMVEQGDLGLTKGLGFGKG
jgi:hypothetical protein